MRMWHKYRIEVLIAPQVVALMLESGSSAARPDGRHLRVSVNAAPTPRCPSAIVRTSP